MKKIIVIISFFVSALGIFAQDIKFTVVDGIQNQKMEVKLEVKMDNTFGNNLHLSYLTPFLTPFLIVYRINKFTHPNLL